MHHVLGIDAGGTKTVCLLADAEGRIAGEGIGPGGNLLTFGEEHLERALRQAIDGALHGHDLPIAAVCLGLAGVDRAEDERIVRNIVARIGYQSHVVIVNDALIALWAGTDEPAGIVIVAGTGSIVYGRNARNVAARAGGWGHIIGDEGSGYWIGREVLRAVVRAADGRGPRTRLTGAVLEHFGLADLTGLPRIVYDLELPRANVAALGPVVQAAHDAGDAVATRILTEAVEELVFAAGSVVRQLDLANQEFHFVLAGGVFRAVPWLAGELPVRLAAIAPQSHARVIDDEPAMGAVRLALAELRGGLKFPRYA